MDVRTGTERTRRSEDGTNIRQWSEDVIHWRRCATLNIYPAADGVQHCEVAGMRDTLDALAAKLPKWGWLQRYVAAQNWEIKIREMNSKAPVDPTVKTRAALAKATQCASVGPYRPEALRNHDDFKQYYTHAE